MILDRGHVILAAAAALVSWLLVTHLLPSLRWLPHAFLAGFVSAFAFLAYASLVRARLPAEQELPQQPYPAFLKSAIWQREKTALNSRSAYRPVPIWPSAPSVSSAFDNLLALLLDDHISAWYDKISSRPLFRNEIDKAIRGSLYNAVKSASDTDLVEAVILRIVPIVTAHFQDFYVAERLVRGKNLTRDVTESDELNLAVATKFKDGKIHKAASLASAGTGHAPQQAHIRKSIDRILPVVLPASLRSSPAVMILVREIVSCAVLTPVLTMLEDPDTWNQMIESFGRTLLQDRKTVKKLRAALDEHAPKSPRSARQASMPHLRPNSSERQFERFIRALRSSPTLSDARRCRNELASQIRREAEGDQTDPIFLRRLQAGRRILEQRIEVLTKDSVGNHKTTGPTSTDSENNAILARLRVAPLRDVLHDPSGLSYFTEFMDRSNKMRLVQFWVTIDGFRNPLEDDVDDAEFTLQEKATYMSAESLDIAQVKSAYLDELDVALSHNDRTALNDYMTVGDAANMQLYLSARRAVLRAQTTAYEDMRDNDFDAFKRSDLFYKWVATEQSMSAQSTNRAPPTPRSPSTLMASDDNVLRNTKVAAPNRPQSAALRRAAASSVDLTSTFKPSLFDAEPRRSVDDTATRPLFGTDLDDDFLARSSPSILTADSTSGFAHKDESGKVLDVMQKELDEIMDQAEAEDDDTGTYPKPTPPLPSLLFADDDQRSVTAPTRPNLASLGLVSGSSLSGVFADDLFADEQENYIEDEKDAPDEKTSSHMDIKEAAPGDLGLSEAIHSLNAQIDRLTSQDKIIDSLKKKAELTNNAAELRILRKSKHSLQREIERAEMQKQQYVIQESDNSLYGKASVSIESIMVGREEDGHEYAIYVIEVRRQAGDSLPAAAWSVTRRYSEFHDLHKRLRVKFASVIKSLEFPRRQTLFTLQKDFLRKRKGLLETYLQELIRVPAICRSRELRAFLSQSRIATLGQGDKKVDQGDFVTRIYNSVSDGMEELLGNMPALDQLTVAGHNLISAASTQLGTENVPAPLTPARLPSLDPAMASEAEAEIDAFEDRDATPFVKPISDLFVELFELSRGSGWLRGRAVVVVLHQLLGGTVERKIREAARLLTGQSAVADYISRAIEFLRPGGSPRVPSEPRTAADRAKSRRGAAVVLSTLIPDMASSVVGKANAQAASRKIVAVLNNERLNAHLVLTLFDEFLAILFPEMGHATGVR